MGLSCGVLRLFRVIAVTLLCAVAAAGSPAPLPAQPGIDSLLTAARARALAGDTSAALELFEAATDRAPRNVEALYARSHFMVSTLQLGFSNPLRIALTQRLLTRGSELAPRDARFVLEIGRLRLRTPLMRADGERLFARALAVAREAGDQPLIAECAAEYARVYDGRYRSIRNRRVYTSGLVFDPQLARIRFNYTREFLEQQSRAVENAGGADRDGADRLYREALRAVPGHLPSTAGLIALLYDEQRYDEMRALAASARQARAANMSPVLPDGRFLERAAVDTARLRAVVSFAEGLAAWRMGAASAAQQAFEHALAGLPLAERTELLDIGRLLREGDSVRVAGLADSVRAATTQAYWDAADPLLSTPANEARLEYLARVAVTLLRYDDPLSGLKGWRSDRGQIVIRYGEPPIEALFPPTSDLLARDATGRVITVFRYPALDLEFVFAGAPTLADASFAGDFRSVAENARRDEPFRLDNVAVARTIDTLLVQATRFRGRTEREHHVVTAMSVPAARFYKAIELDRSDIMVRAFVGPLGRMRVADSSRVAVALPVTRDPVLTRVDTLPSGDFRLRLEAVDPAVDAAAGRAHVALDLPTLATDRLVLSDVMMGRRTGPVAERPRSWSEARIQPLAAMRVPPRDTFALYWETYGARPSATGAAQLEVALQVELLEITRDGSTLSRMLGNVADMVGLTAEGETQLGVRFARSEPIEGRDRIPITFTLSLGTAPAGRYRLTVSVRDTVSGQRAETQREFVIGASS